MPQEFIVDAVWLNNDEILIMEKEQFKIFDLTTYQWKVLEAQPLDELCLDQNFYYSTARLYWHANGDLLLTGSCREPVDERTEFGWPTISTLVAIVSVLDDTIHFDTQLSIDANTNYHDDFRAFSISPDYSTVFFGQADEPIWVTSPQSVNPAPIQQKPDFYLQAQSRSAWSADGALIAITGARDSFNPPSSIHLFSPDTLESQLLLNQVEELENLQWINGSKVLFFSGNYKSQTGAWRLNLETGTASLFDIDYNYGNLDYAPPNMPVKPDITRLSPDGSKIFSIEKNVTLDLDNLYIWDFSGETVSNFITPVYIPVGMLSFATLNQIDQTVISTAKIENDETPLAAWLNENYVLIAFNNFSDGQALQTSPSLFLYDADSGGVTEQPVPKNLCLHNDQKAGFIQFNQLGTGKDGEVLLETTCNFGLQTGTRNLVREQRYKVTFSDGQLRMAHENQKVIYWHRSYWNSVPDYFDSDSPIYPISNGNRFFMASTIVDGGAVYGGWMFNADTEEVNLVQQLSLEQIGRT
ncbi:MAG: hypothetical protein AAGD96_23210 [Chloroflexota bacterium]